MKNVEFQMVEYFINQGQCNVHGQEIHEVYKLVMYTRKFYQNVWRICIIPLFLFLASIMVNNLPMIPKGQTVAAVLFIASAIAFSFFLVNIGRIICKMPTTNGFQADAARDITAVMKTFRNLTGTYPSALGQEGIRDLLKKTARRIDLYNRTDRPEKAQKERQWLRAVYDAAHELTPVPSYEKLFS